MGNIWLCIQCLLFFLIIATQTRATIPAIIVFGDSSVDAGNNNHLPTIVRSNFAPYGRDFPGGARSTGRFSNGRVVTDFLSEAFGLKPIVPAYLDTAYNISDFAMGVTFASAGTGYDNATSDVLGTIPLWKELDYYKEYQQKLRDYQGDALAYKTIVDSLYMISMGTNDFLENYFTQNRRRSQYKIDEYQNFLIEIAEKFITDLHNLGALKISLGGLPPMGCMPLERAQNVANANGCVETYNVVAMSFNEKLGNLVEKLNNKLAGIQLVFSNPYYILLQIIQKPSLYGFDVSQRGCCATGTFEMGLFCDVNNPFTCKDASKYVFWDAFHPSDRTNEIVSDHVFKTHLYKLL